METKKIAIIGGGASGLISGYLLSKKHKVTLFEKEPILGGNVKTLNKNILGTNLPSNINIENGVLGFSENYYPKFHQLLKQLKISTHCFKPSISLFWEDKFFPARTASYLNFEQLKHFATDIKFRKELFGLIDSKKKFAASINQINPTNKCFSDYTSLTGIYKDYLQALYMLSFSTPFELVPSIPQSFLNNYLKSLPNSTWSFIQGGVFSYMEAIIKNSNFKIVCNAKNLVVNRINNKINLKVNGDELTFDAVVIATTPGSIKSILKDMEPTENEIFGNMNDQSFSTTAHTDLTMYGKFRDTKKTPMDLFVNSKEHQFGYNTFQNEGYQLKTNTPYCFAYNLNHLISKDKIIHQANHVVPIYNKNHDQKVEQINQINGNKNTFYVGAYLGNGLHEGAVTSAFSVASKFDCNINF